MGCRDRQHAVNQLIEVGDVERRRQREREQRGARPRAHRGEVARD